MARPDGKSVYVTLPADRKTPSFAFAEGGVFLCFQTNKKILCLIYSDFIPFYGKSISDFIPFYDKTISDFIPFYSFSVDKYKKTEYNIGNKT